MGGFTSVPVIESFPIGDIIDTTPGYVTITTNTSYIEIIDTEKRQQFAVREEVPLIFDVDNYLRIRLPSPDAYSMCQIRLFDLANNRICGPNPDGEYTLEKNRIYVIFGV